MIVMKTGKTRRGRRTMTAVRYAAVLDELAVPQEELDRTVQILDSCPELKGMLESPVISKAQRGRVIDRVFPECVRNFLKAAADRGGIGEVAESIDIYREQRLKKAGIITAGLIYAEPPDAERLKKMEQFICRQYGASGVRWEMEENTSLIGGFTLRVNGREYDYSVLGRLKGLEQKLTWR